MDRIGGQAHDAFLSDELAPIDLETFEIHPYPRAVCLKGFSKRLPEPTDNAICTEYTLHIPADAMPCAAERKAVGLEAIFFLNGTVDAPMPVLTEMSESTAAALLYSHGLNQLAHAGDGLHAVARLASHSRCYGLSRGEPEAMRLRILDALADKPRTAAVRSGGRRRSAA